jgi:hypothetical protein
MKTRAFASTALVTLSLVALLLLTPNLAASPPAEFPEVPRAVAADGYYDSGWQIVAKDSCKVFSHNLGGDPDDYAVELLFLDGATGGLGIHRRGYGGLDDSGKEQGAHWQRLRANTIQVCRGADASLVDRVRVRVFVPVPSSAIADGGWKTINPGQTLTYNHNLGITPRRLTVGLWFKDTTVGPTSIGIHHLGYGGLAIRDGTRLTGAHWHNLTNNTVKVTRHPDDTRIGKVRFIVVEADEPAYDSLFKPINRDQRLVFNHGLNWNPEMLLVRGECYWPTLPGPPPEWGIHHGLAGGNVAVWLGGRQGSNMQRVRKNTLEVERWADDQVCPEVRVRIWKRAVRAYTPLILRRYP